LKKVFNYLNATAEYKVHVKGDKKAVLCAASDASWDSMPASKSVSGYCINIGEFPVAWRTKKQPLVALSSCEAEVSAMCDVVRDLIPLRGLIAEIFPSHVSYPIVIETDSQSAIDLVRNGSNPRSRHFGRRVNYVNDELERGNIVLQFTPGKELRADMLTKSIPGSQLSQVCREDYGLY
jgi:hypothetical protein